MFSVTVITTSTYNVYSNFSTIEDATRFFFEQTGKWNVRSISLNAMGETVNWMRRLSEFGQWVAMDMECSE